MENIIQQVMVKYIKGGKEIVQYCPISGKCWVERHLGDKISILKTFNTKSQNESTGMSD